HTSFSRDWSSDVCSSDLRARRAPNHSLADARSWVLVNICCNCQLLLRYWYRYRVLPSPPPTTRVLPSGLMATPTPNRLAAGCGVPSGVVVGRSSCWLCCHSPLTLLYTYTAPRSAWPLTALRGTPIAMRVAF